MEISGKIVNESGSPVEFATVFVSDAKGNPVQPNRNTSTDSKGVYTLNGVNESDYITARQVGLIPATFPASAPVFTLKLKSNALNTLAEVEVTADKVKKSHVLRNVLIAGGVLALIGLAFELKRIYN